MSDKPILFSAPMVRALLSGTKTQTRRVIKGATAICREPCWEAHRAADGAWRIMADTAAVRGEATVYLDRAVGDRLYVRETFALCPKTAWALPKIVSPDDADMAAYYRADFDRSGRPRWKPSIHMPRWASRITLTVTDVRVQRLQDISEADAIAEGATSRPHCSGFRGMYDGWSMDWSRVGELSRFAKEGGRLSENDVSLGSAVTAFASFINETDDQRWNLKDDGLWAKNPWVAAYTFTVAPGNIDQIARAA